MVAVTNPEINSSENAGPVLNFAIPKSLANQDRVNTKQLDNLSDDLQNLAKSETLSQDQIKQKASELLVRESIPIPEEIYANAWGRGAREQIKQNYLKRREYILKVLKECKTLYTSSDADGSCTFKTVNKVENTRATGSHLDKYFLRMLLKGYKRIKAYFEMNTARTAFVPGPSLVGTEGPKFRDSEGNWHNPRSPNEISGLLHEFGIHNLKDKESRDLYQMLVMNGLSGGVRHDPRHNAPLQIKDETIKYGKFIDAMNDITLPDAPDGFLASLEKIVANGEQAKPLKVLEYKSIPWVFIDHPEFTVVQYMNYINLAKRCRENSWSKQEFFKKLNESDVNLPMDYYNPAQPPASEEALTRKLRLGMLACLTPHAFDSDNVVRDDKKIEFYKTLSKFARSSEAQDWAAKTYGIPQGTDLFTINGKSVKHIDFDDFNHKFSSLDEFRKHLEDEAPAPVNKDHILLNVIENPQPYCEIAPNTSKADVLPGIDTVRQNNFNVIGVGDSPGSDAVMLAQAIILGGAGFIVRGLMDDTSVAGAMVEQLAKPMNQWHEQAMTAIDLGDDKTIYKLNSTGETKTKAEWAQYLLDKCGFREQIFHCNNIHENNAFNAAIFSEFFEGDPEFSMKLDENADWVQKVLASMNKRSLVTPINEAGEKALEGQVYEKSLEESLPWFSKIPVIGQMFDPYNAGKTFNSLLGGVSKVLVGTAPIEILAEALGAKGIAYAARLAQRFAYGVNTVASGVSRGLYLSSHKFYWQFIGEVFGLASTFFPQTSTFGRTLRAINQTVLIGRANELAMRTNYNLDGFAKDKETSENKEKIYASDAAKPFKDKKQVAAKLTKDLMQHIDFLSEEFLGGVLTKVPFGKAIASTYAQFIQAMKMALDFISVPALRKFTLVNFFSPSKQGLTKMSKNSGKPYGEVHEEQTYAFAGMATFATAIASTVLGKLTGSKTIDTVLTNIANMIPALGIVTAGKLVQQDQAGDPRLFTDVAKKQQNYSPEKAGWLQTVSGWMMFVFGAFQHTTPGAVLYNLANGVYFEGIREQLKVGIDDSAVNKLTRQGRYYVVNDKKDPSETDYSQAA